MNEQKILVVDDNKSMCHVLKELLIDDGYAVDTVFRGDDALQELQVSPYHLVLLDLKLPGMSGGRVLQEIKKTFPGTDVIIMTSHASIESAVEALRLGAQDYLTKPLDDLDIVSQVIKKTFEKRRILEENERLNRQLQGKARELESSVRRLSSLNNMGQALHSILEIRDLLDYFVELVAGELATARVSLMLLDRETDELLVQASVGIDERLAREVRIRRGEGIAGWVVQEGQAVLVKDIEGDSRFMKRTERDYTSDSFISAPLVLSVPIKYQHKVLGVININNRNDGGVFTQHDLDFVTTLSNQAAIAIQNAAIFEELKETHFEAITALAEALEAKDATTGRHSDRISRIAVNVAVRLGLSEDGKKYLRYAAVLHDIGKIGVPERILQKPGKLTPEEFEEVKKHPQIGASIAGKVKFLSPVAPLILTHHERYDGRGYPRGIPGAEIPMEARIVAVMDAYDAMLSDRPYRKSLGRERAIRELQNHAGSQFDPRVVNEFLIVLEELRERSDEKIVE